MQQRILAHDVTRLIRAAEQMTRVAQDIARRGQDDGGPPATDIYDHPAPPVAALPAAALVHAAKRAMAAHLQQPDFGTPAVFRSGEWLLMLELFAAGRSGRSVSVKAASLTLGGAMSTANRTILALERLELIESVSDAGDARRRLLRLTPRAEAILARYLADLPEHSTPPMRLSLRLSQVEA